MTVPADNHSENDKPDLDKSVDPSKADAAKTGAAKPAGEPDGGKALATAASSPVNPFLAAASEHIEAPEAAAVPRPLASRMLDYSAHAAIIVGLIGFAWTVGDHVVNRPAADPKPIDLKAADLKAASLPVAATPLAKSASELQAAPETRPAPKRDEMTELRQSNQKMHDEIRALRSSIETLRNVVRRDTTPEQVRMLSAGLESVKGNIGAMRTETSSAIAQLNTKVDKLQPGKVRDLSDRIVRLEHQTTDTTSTASIPRAEPAKAAPKPPVKPASLASTETQKPTADEKPQAISGWLVRDVYQGVALVENKRGGTMEVVPGVTIPGAGVVKSIDRHANGWTVTTTKGQFASAAPAVQSRPTPRGYGRGYGYGYGYGPGAYRYGY